MGDKLHSSFVRVNKLSLKRMATGKPELTKHAKGYLVYCILSGLCPSELLKLVRSLMADNLVDSEGGDFEVEYIADYYQNVDGEHYEIKWLGWPIEFNSWAKATELNCTELLMKFHREGKPRPKSVSRAVKLSMLAKRLRKIEPSVMLEHVDRIKEVKGKGAKSSNDILELNMKISDWERQANEVFSDEPIISIRNHVDLEGLPENFRFMKQRLFQPGILVNDRESIVGCDCTDCFSSKQACCAAGMNAPFAYNQQMRVIVPPGTPIYECNSKCKCGPKCSNRVVQRGRQYRLSIFRTADGRGWGVSSDQRIPKGAFVAEYVGEIVTAAEASQRSICGDAEMCLFDLDFASEESPFTIDAAQFGNISRFFNHACEPNLQQYAVWCETLDERLPRIAFFTSRFIERGEELTFDYLMQNTLIDRIDQRIPCLCGAKTCRKFLF